MTVEQGSYPTASGEPQVATAETKRRSSPLAPLRGRNFSLLFWGQLISVLGDQAYSLALPWTVLIVTGDPRQLAVVLAAEALPRVLFLLIGGALADRLSPRLVMLVADLGRAAVVGALGVALISGLPPLWVVALLAGLQGVGSGLFMPGTQALLPRTVDADDLPAANGLMQVTQFLSLTLGPVLGGVATSAQAVLAFLADGASFLISALTLFGIQLPARQTTNSAQATPVVVADATEGLEEAAAAEIVAQKSSLFGDIGAGIGYAFRQPLLRTTMAVTVLGNFAVSGTFNVALIVLINQLTHNALTLGLVFGALGVGGILGGLGAALLGRLRRRGVVALVFWIFMALAITAIPFAARSAAQLPFGLDTLTSGIQPLQTLSANGQVGVIAALLAIIGFILAIGDTMFLTIMQQRIAPEYLARVFSVQFVAGGITQPLSLVVAGFVVVTLGPGAAFLAGGALLLVAILIGLSSRALREV
jgi:predicted MFS family arabinose efflux permease